MDGTAWVRAPALTREREEPAPTAESVASTDPKFASVLALMLPSPVDAIVAGAPPLELIPMDSGPLPADPESAGQSSGGAGSATVPMPESAMAASVILPVLDMGEQGTQKPTSAEADLNHPTSPRDGKSLPDLMLRPLVPLGSTPAKAEAGFPEGVAVREITGGGATADVTGRSSGSSPTMAAAASLDMAAGSNLATAAEGKPTTAAETLSEWSPQGKSEGVGQALSVPALEARPIGAQQTRVPGTENETTPFGTVAPQPGHPVALIARQPTEIAARLPVPIAPVQLMESISRSVVSSKPGRYSVTLQLHPEHLGEVRLSLNLHGREVQTVLEVTNPAARQVLEQRGDELRQGLREAGLTLTGFEVNTGQSGQNRQHAELEAFLWERRRDRTLKVTQDPAATEPLAAVIRPGKPDGRFDTRA